MPKEAKSSTVEKTAKIRKQSDHTNQDQRRGYTKEQNNKHILYLENLRKDFYSRYESKPSQPENSSLSDFERLRTLGTGAFGRVYLVRHKPTLVYYALKVCDKEHIIKEKQLQHTLMEKKILYSIKFRFVISLQFFFKDHVYVYFVLPLVIGGELFTHLRNAGRFKEPIAKFYASQIILALEYLHFCGLIFRDLKPENVLLDREGYVKLADFGFCKLILNDRTRSLCGTPEYLAPEIIQSKSYSYSVDWWALGIIIFEMTAGHPPFFGSDPVRIYEKIVYGNFKCPSYFTVDLKDLIKQLLQSDVSKRLGNNGPLDMKNHVWFKDIVWDDILDGVAPSPIVPVCVSYGDTQNFDNFDEILLRRSSRCLFEMEFKDF